jgi:hypothetical protein
MLARCGLLCSGPKLICAADDGCNLNLCLLLSPSISATRASEHEEATMAINPAFLGHGMFTEFSVKKALKRFESYTSPNPANPPPVDGIDRFVFAMKDMEISTVWIQLFTRSSAGDVDPTPSGARLRKDLIARLTASGIKVAGWGYCAAKNRDRDVDLIKNFRDDLGMTAFVIDAEPETGKDVWTESQFDTFTRKVNTLFGTDNLALSTWPVLQIQDEPASPVIKLMKIAAPRVCLFAPQAYWMNYPKKVHYDVGFKEADFPRNDPVSFVRLVIEAWRRLGITNPLVITGQAYWGEGSPSKNVMSAKADRFATNFADWPKIVGYNWYHAGKDNTNDDGSMSDAMIDSIIAAHLGGKPYQAA